MHFKRYKIGMKVLIVNGSPHLKGATATALAVVENSLHKDGVETEWFQLGGKPVRGCIDCRHCFEVHRCAFDDDPCNALIEAILAADGVVIGTPTYFAGANGALTAVLDRVFYAAVSHGQLFKGKPAAAVATFWRSGATDAIDRINKYFQFGGMPVASSCYWNVMMNPKEAPDEKGVYILSELGDNLAELVKRFSNNV